MTDVGSVVAGWTITGAAVGVYVLQLQRRIRKAVKNLPPEERPPWA